MRLLIVAMSESIHTARWLSQIKDQGWDIHLFPSIDHGSTHNTLKNMTVYHSFYSKQRQDDCVNMKGIPVPSSLLSFLARESVKKLIPNYRVAQLKKIIDKIKPDIIHSMETQAAGYLISKVRNLYKKAFPIWMHTIWGSDLSLFGQLNEHVKKIRDVMENCDYLLCECKRDIVTARNFGFRGGASLITSAEGGFDLKLCEALRSKLNPSERRSVMLKGYQGWAGRALVGLRALESCAEELKDYEVLIFSASRQVSKAATLFEKKTGVPVRIIPCGTHHDEMLKLHGKSRLSIGLSISDGLPSSLLEAMVMGSFPIQSWTACMDELIEDGRNGILVPPEDAEAVAKAIRSALTEDDLVNDAATKNHQIATERLDHSILKPKAIDIYTAVTRKNGIEI